MPISAGPHPPRPHPCNFSRAGNSPGTCIDLSTRRRLCAAIAATPADAADDAGAALAASFSGPALDFLVAHVLAEPAHCALLQHVTARFAMTVLQ